MKSGNNIYNYISSYTNNALSQLIIYEVIILYMNSGNDIYNYIWRHPHNAIITMLLL
jgi:hypothetical protein